MLKEMDKTTKKALQAKYLSQRDEADPYGHERNFTKKIPKPEMTEE